MTDNTQELDKILTAKFATKPDGSAWCTLHLHKLEVGVCRSCEAKQALLDWHNKQVEEIIKKPHILPKNAQHLESVKQGINFYHRQMRKRVDRLKEAEL